jgi:thioredoxin
MSSRFHKSWIAIAVVALLIGAVTWVVYRSGAGDSLTSTLPSELPTNGKTTGEDSMSIRTESQGKIEHATDANFTQKVLNAKESVLVDFYADWCGPCKALAPLLEELARETPNARVVKVNVDHSPELAARYEIDAIPKLLVFKNGEIVGQHMGLASKATLKSLLTP